MLKDSKLGKRSEPTVNSLRNGNGHGRTVPATGPSILRTVIPDESESSSQTRYGSRAPRRTRLPLSPNIRRLTSQPEPTAIDFAALKDGSLIEIVEDPENPQQTMLAVWKDGIVSYHRQLNCDGRQLVPLPRSGEIIQHVRLPRCVRPYESTARLIYKLAEFISRHVSIKDGDLLPLASFILASWVVDRLPIAPYLSITGLPQSGKTTLLRVLRMLCRRALIIAPTALAEVYQACGQLMPTVLIDDCDSTERPQQLRRLLRIGTTRDVLDMRNSKLFSPYGMKAIVWNEPCNDLGLNSRGVQIEMVETDRSDLGSITDDETKVRASELCGQLLQFRFEHYSKIRIQTVPGEERLRVRSRDLSRCFAACVDEREVREHLSAYFGERDILKREPLPVLESSVLAVLFSEVHPSSYAPLVLIKDLRERANKILKENGEYLHLSPRRVGAILTSFGISHRKRTSYGYQVLLTEADQARIHKLANTHGIDYRLDYSVRIKQRECHLCGGGLLKTKTETLGSDDEQAMNVENT